MHFQLGHWPPLVSHLMFLFFGSAAGNLFSSYELTIELPDRHILTSLAGLQLDGDLATSRDVGQKVALVYDQVCLLFGGELKLQQTDPQVLVSLESKSLRYVQERMARASEEGGTATLKLAKFSQKLPLCGFGARLRYGD